MRHTFHKNHGVKYLDVGNRVVLFCSLLLSCWNLHATEADLEALRQGSLEIVEDTDSQGRRWVTARFWMMATAEEVFAQLADASRFPEFVPEVRVVDQLESGENYEVVRVQAGSGLFSVDYVMRRELNRQQGVIQMRRQSGSFKEMEAEWHISDAAGGVLVVYRTFASMGFWVPGWITRQVSRRTMPQMVENLRKRVDSGGTWNQNTQASDP